MVVLASLAAIGHQVLGQTTVGIQPFGSYQGSPGTSFDQINLSDLGVHISIPLYSHKARGASSGISIRLQYDGIGSFEGGNILGWNLITETASGGSVGVNAGPTNPCSGYGPGGTYKGTFVQYFYTFTDETGFLHPFAGLSTVATNCGNSESTTSLNESAGDGSGYLLSATGNQATVTDPSGTKYAYIASYTGATTVTDSNGNTGEEGAVEIGPYPLGYTPTTLTDSSNISARVSGGDYTTTTTGVPTSRAPTLITYTDTSGNTQTITIAYKLYDVYYAVGNGTSVFGLVDSITYPDESAYHFGYQASSCKSSYSSGILGSVELPTGGTINYQSPASSACTTNPQSSQLTRSTSDGTTTYSSTSNATSTQHQTISTTSLSKPDGSAEAIQFVYAQVSEQNIIEWYSFETAHSWANAGTPLKSTMKCYNGSSGTCTTTPVSLPISQIATTTTLDSGPSSRVVQSFNNNALPTEIDEYDYGASTATRKTLTAYASLGNNTATRPQSVTVQDGSSHIIGQTTYGYDEYSLTGLSLKPTSNLPGHGAVAGSRGNRTSQHTWILSSNTSLDTYWQYDDAGNVAAMEDPRKSWTYYGYDSATDNCLNSTTYPAPSTSVSVATAATCDPNTGLQATSTDLNGVLTTYSYNSMLHPSGATVTSGSLTVGSYTIGYSGSTLPETITTTVTATPSATELSTTILDGLGRTSSTTRPSGAIVSTTYDSMGRVSTVTNPHFASDSGIGTTTHYYDALSRPIAQKQPDGNFLVWCYDNVGSTLPSGATSNCSGHLGSANPGTWVNVSDENRHEWQRTNDSLGRLTQVLEPSGGTSAPTLETDYIYDLLNNLSTATQGGASGDTARVRSFTYDSLSRLLSANDPETGLVCNGVSTSAGCTNAADGYDANGNLLAKTDARGVTTSYTYDALNRLLSKTYSNGALSSCYQYDGSGSNRIGRLTSEWTQAGACPASVPSSGFFTLRSILAYDPMGRVISEQQCTPGKCSTSSGPQLSYTYDLAGDPTVLTNSVGAAGSSLTLITGFDAAAHMNNLASSWTAYPTALYTLPVGGYGPVGPLNWTLGPNLSVSRTYTNRLWVNGITVTGQVP